LWGNANERLTEGAIKNGEAEKKKKTHKKNIQTVFTVAVRLSDAIAGSIRG